MAHELEIVDGKAQMFYRGESRRPWHSLGFCIPEDQEITTEEAIKLAGLDWEVEAIPAFTQDGRELPFGKVIQRKTDKKMYDFVGNNWTPLQNTHAFDWFDPFLEAKTCKLDTAGSLKGGEAIWAMAQIIGDPLEVVKGDYVEKYLLLSNSHKAGVSARISLTPIRVVCWNTLSASHSSSESKFIRVRHSKDIKKNLDEVRDIINLANNEFETTIEKLRAMTKKEINVGDLLKYVKVVLSPKDKSEEEVFKAETSTKTQNIIDQIVMLSEVGAGSQLDGVRGTMYGAYQAVTNYLSHVRGTTVEKRYQNLWMGSSAEMNKRAFELALTMSI